MYIYIYIYSSHFNCVGSFCGLIPRLLTTWYWSDQEVIYVWKRSCNSWNSTGLTKEAVNVQMRSCESRNSTGPTKEAVNVQMRSCNSRNSTGPTKEAVNVQMRAEMEQEQSKRECVREWNRNKWTLHQKRVRQRRKRLTDWGSSNVHRKSLVETGKTNV